MEDWIDRIQHSVSTGARSDDLHAAISACEDTRISKFLQKLVTKEWDDLTSYMSLADELRSNEQHLAGLTVNFLCCWPMLLNISNSPLEMESEDREAIFGYFSRLKQSLIEFPDLLPLLAQLNEFLGKGYMRSLDAENSKLAYAEAVDQFRTLAEVNQSMHRPNVAGNLYNLGIVLVRQLRDLPAARIAFKESTELYRSLSESEPELYQVKLYEALGNLARILLELDKYSEAQETLEESLALIKTLPVARQMVLRNDTIKSWVMLTKVHAHLLEYSAACAACEEALRIYCTLSGVEQKVAESDTAMNQELLEGLNLVINSLIETNEYKAGLTLCERTLTICESLTKAGLATYHPIHASTLNRQAIIYRFLFEYPAAKKAHKQALALYRTIAVADQKEHWPDVAVTLVNLAILMRDQHKHDIARSNFEEAVNIYRKLAAIEPAIYQIKVARTLMELANLLIDTREYMHALLHSEETLLICKTQLNPELPACQSIAAGSLNDQGIIFRKLGELSTAREAFEKSLALYRTLVDIDPTSYEELITQTLSNFSVTLLEYIESQESSGGYRNVGISLINEASIICKEASDRSKKLAVAKPSEYKRLFATTLLNSANLKFHLKKYESARANYKEALDIYRKLGEIDPIKYQLDIAVSLNNLAFTLYCQKKYASAYNYCQDAIDVAEQMPIAFNHLHLAKVRVATAYILLMREAIERNEVIRAFSLAAAMRAGGVCSNNLQEKDLQATQSTLARLGNQHGCQHRILVASRTNENELLLGLILADFTQFYVIEGIDWASMFLGEGTVAYQRRRQLLATSIWSALPRVVQSELRPRVSRPSVTMISGDSFFNAFPWELLRFGKGENDYLGLHSTLPRVRGILDIEVEAQCAVIADQSYSGRMAVLAPHDTDLRNILERVPEEVKAVCNVVETLGGQVIASALGSHANDQEFERQLSMQPDIWYYSGHGDIVQNEEVLVLHSAWKNTSSQSKRLIGREQLKKLSEKLQMKVFSHRPLVVLNSCQNGRTRSAGGASEDLVSAFISAGAGAVIAASVPIYDAVAKVFGEALFDAARNPVQNVGEAIINARRNLATGLCSQEDSAIWGAWASFHIHGCMYMQLPFSQPIGTKQ